MIDSNIIKQVFFLLKQKGVMLITAESLTGGLIASEFTKFPGASEVLWGGYVVYTADAKIELLNVEPKMIKNYGLVSAETVEAMAFGAVKTFFDSSKRKLPVIAAAVSGVAGPACLENHKAGTVYISVAFFPAMDYSFKVLKKDSLYFKTKLYEFSGSRNEVREQTVNNAFLHILSLIEHLA